jgi:RNA polymerase sigma factor (sigma-70 family)
MAVIRFPLRRDNFQESEIDNPAASDGAYQSWEGSEFEGGGGSETHYNTYGSEVYGERGNYPPPRPSAKSARRKGPSPAQIIAQSLGPASPFNRAAKPARTPTDVISQSLNRTGYGASEELLAYSFWQVWMEHQEYLRKKCLYLLGSNREDAEDALSTAMLQAFQNFTELAGGIANTRAWLTTIVHNACMDGYRKLRRQKDFFAETEISEFENIPAEYGTPSQSPEDIVRIRESVEELYRLILELPATLREPLLLRTVEHLSYSEIAGRLKLTEANVRKRVQQARDQLRASRLRDGLAELLGL